MSVINEFLFMILSAIVLQNAVLTRSFGASKGNLMLSSPHKILRFGGTLTVVTLLSALLAWPVQYLLRDRLAAEQQLIARYAGTLACVCIVYAAIWLVSKYSLPRIHYLIRGLLSDAAFNSATLGSLLIAFSGGYGLVQTLGFAIGSGIGYTLTILLIYEGRRRLLLSDVPRSFRGMPVMLLYVGILSLAIYGLIGHQLPT